jgi:hypothetical protein
MARKQKKRGIYKDSKTPDGGGGNPSSDNLVDKVADFSYESDALAQLVRRNLARRPHQSLTCPPMQMITDRAVLTQK